MSSNAPYRLHQGRPSDRRLFSPTSIDGECQIAAKPSDQTALELPSNDQPLLAQLEPETFPDWAPQLAVGRPIIVTGALGGDGEEVARSLSALADVPCIQGHHLLFSQAMLGIAAMHKQGQLAGIGRCRLDAEISADGAMEQAVRFKEAYDELHWHVLVVLQKLASLGIRVDQLELSNEVDHEYWRTLRLRSTESVEVEVNLSVQRNQTPSAELELDGDGFEVRWHAGESKEKLTVVRDGRRAARELDRAPWETILLASLPGILAAEQPLYAAAPQQEAVYEKAADLVDQYLHGNARALSRLRAQQRTQDLTAPGAPFEGYGVTAQPGFDVAFLADEVRSHSIAAQSPAAQRVLILRAPLMTRMAMYELFPSLALGQLNAAAKLVGADVQCIDLAPLYVPSRESSGEDIEPDRYREMLDGIRQRLVEDRFDLVAISLEDPKAWPLMKRALTDLLGDLAPNVVVGGRGAGMIEHHLAGESMVDYVIFGEGDLSLIRLLQHLQGQVPEKHVPGLWRPSWDMRERIPPLLPDFNFLPTPDFSGMDLEVYNSTKPALPAPFLPYLFVLGCPYRCAFCANDSAQKGRYRSGERTAQDLRNLRERHGVSNFYFLNNLTNNNPAAFEDFLQFMEREDLDLNWVDCARPYGISDEQFIRMRKVGCRELTFGIDTGSQRLSNLMRKGYKISKAIETAQRAHDHGIGVVINLIVGMPHETDQDFEETVEFVERVRPFVRSFSVSPYVYTPGSPLHDQPRDFGVRRKGDVFDEVGGLRWREHLEARAKRYYATQRLLDDQKGSMYMPGFEEYHDVAAPES